MVKNEHGQACIVGLGARTPVGASVLPATAAVRAGISRFGQHPYMVDRYDGEPMVVAMDAFLPSETGSTDRFLELGLPAAGEALATLAAKGRMDKPLSVIIGLPVKRPGLPEDPGAKVTWRYGEWRNAFPGMNVDTISAGHSAGLMAIQEACRKIGSGETRFYLAGGIESYLEPETLEWLESQDQLHCDSNSWGFIPGEAAGFCLVADKYEVKRLGLNNFGDILTATTERKTNLIKTDSVCLGEGLTKAINRTLQNLPPDIKVDFTICDINGEPYRGDELGYAIVKTSEHFIDPTDFMTPADCWGDVGAASGPLFIMLAVMAGKKGYANGPHTSAWTSSKAASEAQRFYIS
jgi:3-oxoacyl-[acyl-carrier-protein] synthase-1